MQNNLESRARAAVIVSLFLFLIQTYLAAAQGAVAPLTARIGLGGDLAANTVYTVALGKLEGKSDGEIFQDAVRQNALGLGMHIETF